MSFEIFKEIVAYLIREEFGTDMKVSFHMDDGKYIARVRPNTMQPVMKIMGNAISLGVTIRWGSGHQAMVPAKRIAAMMAA